MCSIAMQSWLKLASDFNIFMSDPYFCWFFMEKVISFWGKWKVALVWDRVVMGILLLLTDWEGLRNFFKAVLGKCFILTRNSKVLSFSFWLLSLKSRVIRGFWHNFLFVACPFVCAICLIIVGWYLLSYSIHNV